MKILERINSPEDLRKLPRDDVRKVSTELRTFLLESVSKSGGHLSSNLGTVELTLAIHYVFNTPFDKLVWDKQCIFGKDVLNLVNEISFGYIKPGALDCLKNRKRALQILNGYDTRDIENDTTDYNDITYTTIKKLLEL